MQIVFCVLVLVALIIYFLAAWRKHCREYAGRETLKDSMESKKYFFKIKRNARHKYSKKK